MLTEFEHFQSIIALINRKNFHQLFYLHIQGKPIFFNPAG